MLNITVLIPKFIYKYIYNMTSSLWTKLWNGTLGTVKAGNTKLYIYINTKLAVRYETLRIAESSLYVVWVPFCNCFYTPIAQWMFSSSKRYTICWFNGGFCSWVHTMWMSFSIHVCSSLVQCGSTLLSLPPPPLQEPAEAPIHTVATPPPDTL